MVRLYDGIFVLEIEGMYIWDDTNNRYSEDFTEDFLDLGGLDWDPEHEASLVESCTYVADQISDWKTCSGDYSEDSGERYAEYTIRYDDPVRIVKECDWIKQSTKEKIDPSRVWVECNDIFYQDEYDCQWQIRINPYTLESEVRWKAKNGTWTHWYDE